MKATDKPPPFVTLFRCSNEYITLPNFIKPKATTTRHKISQTPRLYVICSFHKASSSSYQHKFFL